MPDRAFALRRPVWFIFQTAICFTTRRLRAAQRVAQRTAQHPANLYAQRAAKIAARRAEKQEAELVAKLIECLSELIKNPSMVLLRIALNLSVVNISTKTRCSFCIQSFTVISTIL